MKRNYGISIGEVVKRYFERTGLQTKLDETALLQAWPEVVGPSFRKYTAALRIENRVLYVRMNSSVAANELAMRKTDLVQKLNQRIGKSVIDNLQINLK
ncbi:MAG: DUF721 domain-containing protein [Paludibacteraceae bacterium]|nr:DUF721 domain-containing protein [Paludibacteraceae bacterium]